MRYPFEAVIDAFEECGAKKVGFVPTQSSETIVELIRETGRATCKAYIAACKGGVFEAEHQDVAVACDKLGIPLQVFRATFNAKQSALSLA